LAEGKVAVFLLPLVILIIIGLKVYFSSVGRWYRLIVLTISAVALLYGVIYLMPILTTNTSLPNLLSSPEALWNYMTSAGGDPLFAKFGRLTDLRVTVELLGRSTPSLLFGFGPGLISKTGQALEASSALSWYLTKGIGGFQATVVLLETGFLGLITILILLISVAIGTLRVPRMVLVSSNSLQITSFAVVMILYMIAMLYTHPWWSPALSVPFWTFAGMTWTNVRK
jgi:hypothetical protein